VIFVGVYGQAADGTYPKSGTSVQYRCIYCSQLQEGKQPKPGRWLAACEPCSKRAREALKAAEGED
jgi:hypothetical protein